MVRIGVVLKDEKIECFYTDPTSETESWSEEGRTQKVIIEHRGGNMCRSQL